MPLRKKISTILISLLALVLLAVFGAFIYEKYSTTKQERSVYMLTKEEIGLLHDGDIILRKGYGLVSESITNFLKEKYNLSHSGVVCIDSLGNITIIHSLSSAYSETDGVQHCSLKRFCKESQLNTLMVVRYKNNDSLPSPAAIAKRADYYCSKKIPFDNSFDLNTPENFYCTELLWRIFLDVYNLDLYPNHNNKFELGLAPFYNSANFGIVINHQNEKR